MFNTLIDYVFTFFIFSAVGWTIESMYRSLGERRVINSGFLHGPICPIYGSGALVFKVILQPVSTPFASRWWVTLLLGIFAADMVEYITSYLMEKLFHARWWDYSKNFLNINGRVCFKHSIYWAVASFIATYVVLPLYDVVLGFIPQNIRLISVIVILVVFFFDLSLTVKAAIDIQNIMIKLDEFRRVLYYSGEVIRSGAGELKENAEDKMEELRRNFADNPQKFTEWREEVSQKYEEFRKSIEYLRGAEPGDRRSREAKRLFNSYQNLRDRVTEYSNQIEQRLSELRGKEGEKKEK